MRTRMIALAASTAVVAAMAAGGPATAAPTKETAKSYVVLMAETPAVGYTGDVEGFAATKPTRGKKINPNAKNVKAYVNHLAKGHTKALEKAGISAKPINTFTYAANGFNALMTDSQAAALRLQKGVISVTEDVLKQKQTDTSPTFLGLNGAGEAWDTGLTGEGVVVGVIDSGIWPEHDSFADDGTYAAPEGLGDIPCEFGATDYNAEDTPFECQNKLIGARDMRTTYNELQGAERFDSARDEDGHGTHTAATAAGNADVAASIFGIDRGTVSGIAPRASIIAYKGLGELGGYGSDLAGAIDQAVEDGVDVINYSIGSSSSAIGPDDVSFLFAADSGVYVATSAGNSGPGAATIGSPAAVPWLTTVGASTHTRTYEATATLGNGDTYTGASLTEALPEAPLVDAADLKNPLCKPDVKFQPNIKGKVVLCARGEIARVDKSKAVYEQGGAGMILFNQTDEQALITDNHWLPSVHITYSEGIQIREYIAAQQPGNGKGADKGAKAGKTKEKATASLTQGEAVEWAGSVMADFSSRGPVPAPLPADVIRPDVTAPGVNILAGNTPVASSGRPGQLFQAISGTSMSSPHVAGLFALIKQAHPDWSAAMAKSALMTTARQDVTKEDGTTPADPFDMGAGHVEPGTPGTPGSMFDPGIAYDAGLFEYAGYTCGADLGVFSSGSCDFLEGIGIPSEPSQLNVPSLGDASVPGIETLTRTVTNVSDGELTMTASSEAPAGYSVEVSPSEITLAPGDSASFDVTLTNESSPVGEWAFGSLTWSGSGYEARSPIAVKATSLAAPSEVSESGAEGTGSVDVTFGYTGDYSVDAHGLAEEVLTTGTVGQDPDASFAPSDAGNGATAHEVTLSGSALYRLTMTQSDITDSSAPDDVDLDIFVYGPDGTLVASSGAGATNEFIEVANPADGTYTVYVHGWGTGGETVGYTFHSWDVSATPNAGSLQVTSAPASAVLGQTGTVEYSWSGVAAGTTSLGLLVHQDADGVIGTTAVSVTG